MRVFVTGATGFIGSAVVPELVAASHQVLGLARNAAAADKLKAWSVEAHSGELTDIDSLTAGARACDGVIHLAFIHDFSQYQANIEIDQKAVTALVGALEGSGKPFVGTSGTLMVAQSTPATEDQTARDAAGPRAVAESIARDASARGVRSSVVRLSPTVHGAGDKGFVPSMVEIARKAGFAAYIGDGANRWPAVHRLDAARLFRLALEKAPAGVNLHGAAEPGIAARDIAEAIGQGLGVPVRSLTPEEAGAHLGFLGWAFSLDNPTSSALTQSSLGWTPQEPGLLADMAANYFG